MALRVPQPQLGAGDTSRLRGITGKSSPVRYPDQGSTRSLTDNLRSDLRIALGLFLILAGLGWLLMSGHTYARDEETVLAMSRSLFDRHTFALPPGLPVVEERTGAQGRLYGPYGPLQPLLIAPLYGFSKVIAGKAQEPYAGYTTRFIDAMFSPAVHALTAALLFLILCKLGFSRSGSLWTALAYALTTWALPHSRTLFAEPLTALFLVAGFYALLLSSRSSARVRPSLFVVSGICVGLAIAARLPTLIVAPAYALYVLWLSIDSRPTGDRSFMRARFTFHASRSVFWVLGLLAVMIPYMLLNTELYGGPFTSGYGSQGETFFWSTPLFTGLYGLLLSPGKGAFWYAPVLFLLFVSWSYFWRRVRAEALFCAGAVAVTIFVHAQVQQWDGGGAWGPRYLTIALPFMVLPLAGLWGEGGWVVQAVSRLARAGRRALVWTLFAIGLLVNLAGMAVNFNTWVASADGDPRRFEPYYSAIAAHPRLLFERISEWWPGLVQPQGVLLRDGFSYSEGENGAPLPRWTHADARFSVNADSGGALVIRYADHRPPPLPRANVRVRLDGVISDNVSVEPLSGVDYEMTVPLPRGKAEFELLVDTWNPSVLKVNNRDEDLGVQITGIENSAGSPISVTALPQIPPMPASGVGSWSWFYRPDYHHLVDHWAWYLSQSGAPGGLTLRLTLIVLLPSILCLVSGMLLLSKWREPLAATLESEVHAAGSS